MRNSITDWLKLTSIEQVALASILGVEAETIFNNATNQAGRDTLLNMYYLMTSEKVAGDLWHRLGALRWADCNQLGVEVEDPEGLKKQLEASGNFLADGRITCYYKRSCWSLRQYHVEGEAIGEHGLQVYRPDLRADPNLLVADIDTIVFSKLRALPRHAFDILRPDPVLNDPLRARRALEARGIFPQLSIV